MEKPRLALGSPMAEPYLSQLEALCQITPVSQLCTPGMWPPEAEFRNTCLGYDIVVMEADVLGEETLALWKAHGLKLLGCTRGNPLNVDAAACKKLGIPLFYTPGRNAQSVAEYTMTLMLMLQKHIQRAMKGMGTGAFLDAPVADIYNLPPITDVTWMNERVNVYAMLPLGGELYGRTLGLIGFGAIGKRVAKMAVAFGMRVLAYDPYCDPRAVEDAGAIYGSLEETLGAADIVSIHLPVTKETVGMVNESWFARMKDGTKLINTARAAVVDQKAMIQALESGKLSGAAVDVMWIEPCPANHPFLSMDQVIVLPHQAGATVDIDRWQSAMVLEEVKRFLAGQPLQNPFPRQA